LAGHAPPRDWEKFLTFTVAMTKVHLTREQRYTISAMHRQGYTQKMIARTIGKDRPVISRELKRNANTKGKYSFGYAQDMAELRKERMKNSPQTFSVPEEKNHFDD
jgi:IS30 family transposase